MSTQRKINFLSKGMWKTLEDLEHLDQFNRLYSRFQDQHKANQSIPRTFHFIWLGQQDLPGQFIENILSWKQFHPDWAIKLWVDIEKNYTELQLILKRLIMNCSKTGKPFITPPQMSLKKQRF